MNIDHFTKDNYKTIQWSGGTTTELFLYPEGSDYGKRQFDIRVSSAYVKDPSSKFTVLPGVYRHLLPLTDSFLLYHGNRRIFLAPYEIYSFSGDDEIRCEGSGKDFNLMLKNGWTGSLEVSFQSKHSSLVPGKFPRFDGFFSLCSCMIRINGQTHTLSPNDLLLISGSETDGVIDIILPDSPVVIFHAYKEL